MLFDVSKDFIFLDNYINDELIRRLDVANINYAKFFKKYFQIVNMIKKLAQHKYFNYSKTSYNSHKYPKKKKSKSKKSKINLITLDLDSNSNINSDILSDFNSIFESDSTFEFKSKFKVNININISKAKKK